MTVKVAFVSRDPAVRLAGAKVLEQAPMDWAIDLVDRAPLDADVVVCGSDVDDCGGVRFDVDRPEALLPMVAAAIRRPPVIAVTAACGGCGVTTIALHLARSLRGCFFEVAARAGAAERLRLDRDALKTWGAADADHESNRLAALPMAGGFRAMLASHDDSQDGAEVISAASQWFRAVVVDVPVNETLPTSRNATIVVMPPTLPAAVRTRALLEGSTSPGLRAVAVNRQGPGGELTRAALEQVLGERISLELPCSASLRDAEDRGELLPPRSRWARRVERLAFAISDQAGLSPEPTA